MKKTTKPRSSGEILAAENAELRTRLEEAEETLRAIRSGEVDALVVSGPQGEQIYTLKSADYTYRILLETLNEGTLTLTTEGDILYCNRRFAEMIKKPLEKVIASSIRSHVPAADLANFDSLYKKAVMERASGESQLLTGEGKPLPVYLSVKPFEIEGVPAVGMVVMDLAKQKENEHLIRRMQKMDALGTLAGGIAHDFNNILAPILVNTELALLETIGQESRRGLEIVLEAAHRGRKIVKQILAFAASKEGERGPMKLAPVVEESLRLIRSTIPATIEIRTDLAEEKGMVMANPTQVEQVLVNLCANAAHAMREKGGVLSVGLVGVRFEETSPVKPPELGPGSYLRLTVSDTGCGMTPEVMERIFDPFFSTKHASEGSGMGLSVVHGIVKSHEGAISVDSAPGKGSRFSVFLPRIDAVAEKEGVAAGLMMPGNERILLIDDEEIQLQSWKPALERLGYSVAVESNSLKSLRTFRAQPRRFDVVIVDQTMPGMTGAKLATAMLRLRPDLPVILCTGFSEEIDEEQALGLGIRAFVLKPATLSELASTIRRVLPTRPTAPGD
jgi:PAS domain S-box-containing protein